MKKIVLLAAFSLLGSSFMSCDNESLEDSTGVDNYADNGFGTDDGFIPTTPPPPPPPTIKPKP